MDNPLNQVDEAIAALGRGDSPGARLAIALAVARDAKLAAVADVVDMAASELDREGQVSPASWNAIADACPGELRSVVEAWRR